MISMPRTELRVSTATAPMDHPAADPERLRRIVAAVCPRDSGETLRHVREVAQAMSGELTTISVLEGTREESIRSEPASDVVLHGNAAERICDYASFMDADLVVMTLRSAWFRRRTVASEILRRSPCPVMLVPVPAGEAARYRFRRVLCVVQLDGTDGRVLEYAAGVARASGGEVTLLHVVPEATERLLYAAVEPSDRPLSMQLASDRLSRLTVSGRKHSSEIRTGSEPRAIAKVARELHADLIVARDLADVPRRLYCPVLAVGVAGH